jgi:hypothetical protein
MVPFARSSLFMQQSPFYVYMAIVICDGQYREIYVNKSKIVPPLIEMRLLHGYDLRIQTIEGVILTIAALK